MKPDLLIVDDNTSLLDVFNEYFKDDFRVHTATESRAGIALFEKILPAAVILDLRLPDCGGIRTLEALRALDPDVPVIILTAYGEIEEAVQAIQSGAQHFLTKPVDLDTLNSLIIKSIDNARIHEECRLLKEQFDHLNKNMILAPATWKRIHMLSENPDITVFINGPTGSGKSMIAQLIHNESGRKQAPFVHINCAGLSAALLESELFGHERGAFTDARNRKKGLMEIAHNGTLFLDEIGEMPLSVQSKMLSAIESKSFRRIGGTERIQVDTRIITATNADLYHKMKTGGFRQDLFYRLHVMPLELPPLKDRREDIPKLIGLFLGEFAQKMNKPVQGLTDEATAVLMDYDWPGNIRELKNIIERAVMLCAQERIAVHHLPREMRQNHINYFASDTDIPVLPLEEAEKRLIRAALKQADNNKSRAARILQIHVSTLARKIKKYRLGRGSMSSVVFAGTPQLVHFFWHLCCIGRHVIC